MTSCEMSLQDSEDTLRPDFASCLAVSNLGKWVRAINNTTPLAFGCLMLGIHGPQSGPDLCTFNRHSGRHRGLNSEVLWNRPFQIFIIRNSLKLCFNHAGTRRGRNRQHWSTSHR